MNDLYLVGLPGDSVKVIQLLASKLGKSHADIIADALAAMARKFLMPEEAKKSR